MSGQKGFNFVFSFTHALPGKQAKQTKSIASAASGSSSSPEMSFGIALAVLVIYVMGLQFAKPFLIASAPGTIFAGVLSSGVFVLSLTVSFLPPLLASKIVGVGKRHSSKQSGFNQSIMHIFSSSMPQEQGDTIRRRAEKQLI
jgi:hypothetical protein